MLEWGVLSGSLNGIRRGFRQWRILLHVDVAVEDVEVLTGVF
jgi:hypothetical protein